MQKMYESCVPKMGAFASNWFNEVILHVTDSVDLSTWLPGILSKDSLSKI